MANQEQEKPSEWYGEQSEPTGAQTQRELEELGEPDSINAGRPGARVPAETAHPEPPHLPAVAPTPAAGTGTSREIRRSSSTDFEAGERREE